jgi:hypothetical protein
MAILALKLTLTALFIGVASLAQRSRGAALGGLIAGLPLTSAPVSIFLALEYGHAFAARSAIATLLGTVAMSGFCVVYVLTARHSSWPLSTGLALTACSVVTFSASLVPQELVLAAAISLPALLALIAAIGQPAAGTPSLSPPWWDTPGRMATAALAVILITGAAGFIGPTWSGLLSTLPVFACVMGVFSHRHSGYEAAHGLLRGIAVGALGAASFFLVVAAFIETVSLSVTYAVAIVVALSVAALSYRVFPSTNGKTGCWFRRTFRVRQTNIGGSHRHS